MWCVCLCTRLKDLLQLVSVPVELGGEAPFSELELIVIILDVVVHCKCLICFWIM